MNLAAPTVRQRLEYFGLWSASEVVKRMPFWLVRRVAELLGRLVHRLDGRGRRVAEANLTSALGPFSPAERTRIVRQSYQGFARTMLELLWAPNLTREAFPRYAKVEGLDEDPKVSEQPTIYFCLHSSNFEWLSLALSYEVGPGIVIAQQFKNPLLGGLFDRLRSSTGHTVIAQERAMIRMLKHLQGGGYFNMLIDLNLDPRESSVIIDQFDGLKACVTQLHSALALRVQARIVPAECLPQPDGTYRLIYYDPIPFSAGQSSEEIAQRCWDVLEPAIRRRPESWLWSYKHWRFKPDDATETRYPYYANQAKRFDKKLNPKVPNRPASGTDTSGPAVE